MKTEASNALLKTLEEPSGNTLLILTTAHREALLPTIQSRCQPVRFDLLKEEEIGTGLRERKGVDPDRAVTVARIANGSYGMALELLEQDLDVQRENVLSFIRSVLGKQVVPFVESIEVMSAPRDREAVIRFLTLLLIWFRDAMVYAQGRAVINADQLTPIKNFVAKFPDANLVQVLADIEEAISLVKRNAYIMVVLLQLAVHLRANILGTRRTGT
jgi:DNA polymerase-3 subunit delta'